MVRLLLTSAVWKRWITPRIIGWLIHCIVNCQGHYSPSFIYTLFIYQKGTLQVALASCSSTSWIQALMPSSSVVGWTKTGVSGFRHSAYWRHWPSSASVRVHAHTTVSATEVYLLPVLRAWNTLLSRSYLRHDTSYTDVWSSHLQNRTITLAPVKLLGKPRSDAQSTSSHAQHSKYDLLLWSLPLGTTTWGFRASPLRTSCLLQVRKMYAFICFDACCVHVKWRIARVCHRLLLNVTIGNSMQFPCFFYYVVKNQTVYITALSMPKFL